MLGLAAGLPGFSRLHAKVFGNECLGILELGSHHKQPYRTCRQGGDWYSQVKYQSSGLLCIGHNEVGQSLVALEWLGELCPACCGSHRDEATPLWEG